MEDVHERELIERCGSGDEHAFQELVDRYKDLVFALIARTIQDRSRAEDLAQDVFLRLYRGLPYFRGEARLSTWIYRIVLNVAQERNQKQRVPVVELDAQAPDRAPRQFGRADAQFSAIEVSDRLRKAMGRLSPRSRFVLAAHYLHD